MPIVEVDPILASSTPGGFLRAARPLEVGDADWRGGVTFTSNCGGVNPWTCDVSGAKKTVDDLGDPARFDSFLVYAGVRCSGAPVEDKLRQHADIKMRRGLSGALARELHDGATTDNPSLQSEATDITVGSPCVDAAIAGLISTAEDCGGGELVFHAPFVALAALMKYQLVTYSGGKYQLGGYDIIIDGYPNLGPGGTAAAANQVWIYATGPVEYKLGERVEYSHFTGRQNDSVLFAEQLAVLRFDPCCANAIRAEICCTC